MDNRLPTFIGIGAEKSATTWCWACLNEHPEVFMSQPKELNFFNSNFERGVSWYSSHFTENGFNAYGEISPVYMNDPNVCDRISDTVPDATIFAVLRDPFERTMSHMLMEYQTTYGSISDFDAEKARALISRSTLYIDRSLYYKALAPYFEKFDRNQIVVMFFEDVKKDPSGFLIKMFGELGVAPDFSPSVLDKKVNQTQDFKSRKLFDLLRSVSRFVKSSSIGNRFMEQIYRKTTLREFVLDKIQVDKGKPEIEFSHVFSEDDRQLLLNDSKNLVEKLGIITPLEWQS